MRVGIAYDLKPEGTSAPSGPDDRDEEFDSPVTIDALAGVLRGLGHEVERLGDGRALLERVLERPPDFVFNIAEGEGVGRCRESRVPAVLEMLGIPHTGSDALTLAAALDKDVARRWVGSAGVAVPWGVEVGTEIGPELAACRFPAIVKPAWEGSSKGIRGRCVVDNADELRTTLAALRRDYGQPVLVEEYIDGDEVTVGVVGNRPPKVMGVMRVTPREPCDRFVYSLEVKRDFRRQVRYECPPPWRAAQTRAVEEAALTVYRTLGCRDVARIDFRVKAGVPYFIEANPLPGLNPESSDLVIMAGLAGWSYARLIETVWRAAVERYPSVGAARVAS